MIFNIIGLIVGLMILIAGVYYLAKEKTDKDSRKIYGTISGAGGIIVLAIMIKMILEGISA